MRLRKIFCFSLILNFFSDTDTYKFDVELNRRFRVDVSPDALLFVPDVVGDVDSGFRAYRQLSDRGLKDIENWFLSDHEADLSGWDADLAIRNRHQQSNSNRWSVGCKRRSVASFERLQTRRDEIVRDIDVDVARCVDERWNESPNFETLAQNSTVALEVVNEVSGCDPFDENGKPRKSEKTLVLKFETFMLMNSKTLMYALILFKL